MKHSLSLRVLTTAALLAAGASVTAFALGGHAAAWALGLDAGAIFVCALFVAIGAV